jgi:hypothetical protein
MGLATIDTSRLNTAVPHLQTEIVNSYGYIICSVLPPEISALTGLNEE